ncbi:DUF5666 domain-containing protein [Nocardia macrotermitis]|uniref:DUF5666 domain-containing protein n=1 Tax=Nocardia macrotermitis TaxID=2585198 RepID=A0A7K0DE03_9NOCA|nr:DUF5666 domain-containing protein [Nocardia macrotermitis]MQY24033.1 hypothetical protein [Nocardia macrotermitis]
MTTPSDPWAERPASSDAPTEYLGGSGAEPTEYSDAYGSTEPYKYFDQAAGPNPTRALPPYQSQWGVYEGPGPGEAAYDTQWIGPARTMPTQHGPNPTLVGPTELPPDQPDQLPPHRNRRGMWVGLTLVAFAVVVLGAVAVGLFLGGDSSTSSTAAGTTYRTAPTQLPMFPQSPDNHGTGTTTAPQLPGLGGTIDSLGATMGTISANDGSTLTVDSLSGNTITVHTDAKTEVIALGSSTIADLHPGDMVVVQGDKNADGSIQAKIVIGTALPSQGTPTPTPTR